ncbi:retrovirus-related pol polyprotein from transposon TNT 1-94 [Tanacetum coccineum]|uniref:Retrovirus-related pol polyprotein from transposon TNT 1-94 n=1 Tax=Tanacetum coccineum TaxID=301880 RepID=A0ABQ5FM68_9ASTR
MDLCGPVGVASINGKKYILVIVDDYSRFTWVKFLASKDEAPDFIIKFLIMIQVRLNATVRNIRIGNGTEFVNQTLRTYYESVSISHETSVARTPQQNGVIERRNHTLVEASKTMLIYAKSPLFLWAEAVATASKADIGIFIGYAPKKKAYHIYNRRFVTNPIPQQPCNPPPRDDWDLLFQPMFNEYFNPPAIVVSLVPVVNAPRAGDLADLPVSTSIDQDAPLTSIPSTQEQEHSLIISQGFEESPKMPHFHNDLLHESLHEDSTFQGSSSNVRPIHTLFESLGRWTKDHPIANVIGDPSRSISTRKQLQTDAMWCYFDAFITPLIGCLDTKIAQLHHDSRAFLDKTDLIWWRRTSAKLLTLSENFNLAGHLYPNLTPEKDSFYLIPEAVMRALCLSETLNNLTAEADG